MEKNKKNIMVVDDELTITSILYKYLSHEGYNVKTYNSPIDAISELKRNFYPIVISDLNMPEMGGLAFLKWINENTPKTDVMLMTSFGTNQIKEMAKQRGAVNFIGKPIDLKKIKEFVNSRFNENHFTGDVKDLSLEEFLKVFLSSNKKRLIIIKDSETDEEGIIYVFEGRIVEAEFKGLKGEKAFYEITLLNSGSFREEEWKAPEIFRINKPASYLFNEAVKIAQSRKHINNLNEENILKIKQNKKILVVDDNELTRAIIERYLVQKNYNITTAESALDGLQIMIKEHFDLVITDISMPGLSGIEFLLWIKNNFSKTQVIVMTGLVSENLKTFAGQNGALNFLEKPVNLKELDGYIINQLADNTFSGSIRDISLLDYIKILSFGNITKKVCVKDMVINKNAFIYVKEGNVVHAEYDDLKGEEAFYKIIKMKYGVFNDLEWTEPPVNSIDIPLERLLMEAEIVNTEIKIDETLGIKDVRSLQRSNNLHSLIKKAVKDGDIDDENMGIYGLYIGKSTKQQVVDKIKDYSTKDINSQIDNKLMIFDDIGLNILFNEDNVIEEMSFSELFKGKTNSGLHIGDDLQKAIKIYGKPITVTIKGAVWPHIACFSKYGETITSIRLRGTEFFDQNPTQKTNLLESKEKKMEKLEYKKPLAQIPEKTGLDFTIYNDGAMGIKVGVTTKDEVEKLMSKHSSSFNKSKSNSLKYIYDDINVTIIFDDNKIVKEMNFGDPYKGKTLAGIGISNTFGEARKIYGKPRFESFNNIIWDKVSIFSDDSNVISSIRIQS